MRRSVVTGALVWCAVVAVVAVAVWQTIDAAGGDAFGAGPGRAPLGALHRVAGDTEPDAERNHADPDPGRQPPTASPTLTPPPSTPPQSPEQSAQIRSWSGSAGSVVVRCEGVRASLQSTTPANGYRVEIDKRGPQEVRVEFTSGEQEVRVEARCAGGVPRFTAEDRGDELRIGLTTDPGLAGLDDGGRAVGDLQLGEDVGDVVAHGLEADRSARARSSALPLPAGDQLEHLALAVGQRRERRRWPTRRRWRSGRSPGAAISGPKIASPAATARIARTISSCSAPLSR